MKVYPLHIGDTKVPYAQFYYGPWRGWRALAGLARDKRRIIVPIYAYVIDHPNAGPILVDTGINWDMAHAHRQYYKGFLARLALEEDEYLLTREQELAARLKRLGFRAEDIQTVILTHLHEDHLGELRALPHANVVMAETSWDEKLAGRRLRDLSPSFTGVAKSWQLIPFSSGPFHNFERSQDLLGDGSIILLPTPGHARGHLSVLVQMDGYQLLLVGDVIYSLRHLDVDQVLAIAVGGKAQRQQIASILRLQQLRQVLPEMVFVTLHDHTTYQFDHLDPFLADGALSPDERQAIKACEARLFDRPWHLAPDAMPAFLPAPDDSPVGTVAEPK